MFFRRTCVFSINAWPDCNTIYSINAKMKTDRSRHLKEYLKLLYTITLRPDKDGDWIARVEELEGCVARGGTQAEALAVVEEMKTAWIEDALEADDSSLYPSRRRTCLAANGSSACRALFIKNWWILPKKNRSV